MSYKHTYLSWVFAMEIPTRNGLTSFSKYHLVRPLRKINQIWFPIKSSVQPKCRTYTLWLNQFTIWIAEAKVRHLDSRNSLIFSSLYQRRIQDYQWHCWFLYWWCSGQNLLCHWWLHEPVYRNRRVCSETTEYLSTVLHQFQKCKNECKTQMYTDCKVLKEKLFRDI